MKTTKHILQYWLAFNAAAGVTTACPFAATTPDQNQELPDDPLHQQQMHLRRRLSDTTEKKDKVKAIIDNRTKEQQRYKQKQHRSLDGSSEGQQKVSWYISYLKLHIN